MNIQWMIKILLLLDLLWGGLSDAKWSVNKEIAASNLDNIRRAYVESGISPKDYLVTLEFFRPKNSPLDAKAFSDCSSRIVLIKDWLDEDYLFYDTPLFISVLAHEYMHIIQGGSLCDLAVKNKKTETELERTAQIGGLEVLAYMSHNGDRNAKAALIYELRRIFLVSVVVNTGEVPDGVVLSENERRYVDSLNKLDDDVNSAYMQGVIDKIRNDGCVESAMIGSGYIHINHLSRFFRENLGWYLRNCSLAYNRYRFR